MFHDTNFACVRFDCFLAFQLSLLCEFVSFSKWKTFCLIVCQPNPPPSLLAYSPVRFPSSHSIQSVLSVPCNTANTRQNTAAFYHIRNITTDDICWIPVRRNICICRLSRLLQKNYNKTENLRNLCMPVAFFVSHFFARWFDLLQQTLSSMKAGRKKTPPRCTKPLECERIEFVFYFILFYWEHFHNCISKFSKNFFTCWNGNRSSFHRQRPSISSLSLSCFLSTS